jgi:hypothetical protein
MRSALAAIRLSCWRFGAKWLSLGGWRVGEAETLAMITVAAPPLIGGL